MEIIVLGTGSIGRRHAANLETLGAKAVPVSMRETGLARALKRIAEGADGAVIATETALRLPFVEAAAAKGIPLYIEKPLAPEPAALAALYAAAQPIASRSLAGFMMRYHPAFRHLASADLSSTYAYRFEIGHDVTQWRANWRFSESYAARPEGGGVLLDLCHELDMAHCLFPGALGAVECLGHKRYPGIDMATRITRNGPALGTVAMDYLSPVSTRRIEIAGRGRRILFDLIAGRYEDGARTLDFPFARNDMFLAAMRDFLALAQGRAPSAVEHLPRLDLARPASEEIAAARAARHFVGDIPGEAP
jgi:predicted dehydrogenase